MAVWLVVLLVAVAVVVVCSVSLFMVGVIGASRKVSRGPVVTVGRVLFSVLLAAVVVALVAAAWGAISGAVATLAAGPVFGTVWRGDLLS